MHNKVTVVGAGFVGATTAQRIVEKSLADVALIDVVDGLAAGKALDIMESSPIEGFTCKICGGTDYKLSEKSDIVIITAGVARKPGMSRDDLQAINARIVTEIVENIKEFSPDSILIMVTNPLDVMSYLAYKVSGTPSHKVMGMAGVLDSARYRYFLSEALCLAPDQVQAMILGGHGDTMVPLPRFSTASGRPILELLDQTQIEAVNERAKKGGAEIVGLLKTGSAFYAPSSSVVDMVKSILLDEARVMPCCAYLQGEYGIDDLYCGVPVELGKNGIKKIIQLDLDKKEKEDLLNSCSKVRENIRKLSY
ncbi:MAG: malate dehydrogenase [Candidatus Omnitrophica bacterium]|nr:malate dehydrogenase [Candidatus Omnitrophota bacterium]